MSDNYDEQEYLQIGSGRDELTEEDKKLAQARLQQRFEKQAAEPSEGGIGAPAPGPAGYDQAVGISQNEEKIQRARQERRHLPGVQADGSTVGLKTPGLTWTTEDAVDMGNNDIEKGEFKDNQSMF